MDVRLMAGVILSKLDRKYCWVGLLLLSVGCKSELSGNWQWESSSSSWSVSGAQKNAYAGWSVSGVGDVNNDGYDDVLVGEPFYDLGSAQDVGAVHLYFGSSSGLSATADWNYVGSQAGAQLGKSVASGGDVNGDGFGDVLVGQPQWSNGQQGEGRALLFLGSLSGPSPVPDWAVESNEVSARMGYSVAGGGDVNGDGFQDVLVGAPYLNDPDGNGNDVGGVFVFPGEVGGLGVLLELLNGNEESEHFGFSLGWAGDLNQDGFSDVLVGSPGRDESTEATIEDQGSALMFYGSAAGVTKPAGWVVAGGNQGGLFGSSVAGVGDLNTDTFLDVAVGSYLSDGQSGTEDQGSVFLFKGREIVAPGDKPLSEAKGTFLEQAPPQAGAWFGFSIAGVGDLNNDGFDDLVVGSSKHDSHDLDSDEGAAFTYHGQEDPLVQSGLSLESNQIEALFGSAVAGAGDVDGDGCTEVLVGAYGYDGSVQNGGRVFLYPDRSTLPCD